MLLNDVRSANHETNVLLELTLAKICSSSAGAPELAIRRRQNIPALIAVGRLKHNECWVSAPSPHADDRSGHRSCRNHRTDRDVDLTRDHQQPDRNGHDAEIRSEIQPTRRGE